MPSQNKHVSIPELARGVKACEENFIRLVQDAEALLNQRRFLSALNLLRLAVEELGKSKMIEMAATYGDEPNDHWEKFWYDFARHKPKVEAIHNIVHASLYKTEHEFKSAVRDLLEGRTDSIYVNFDHEKNKFTSPKEAFPALEEFVTREYHYVRGLAQLFFEVGPCDVDIIEKVLRKMREDFDPQGKYKGKKLSP